MSEWKSDGSVLAEAKWPFKTTISALDSNSTTETFLSRLEGVVPILGARYLISQLGE